MQPAAAFRPPGARLSGAHLRQRRVAQIGFRGEAVQRQHVGRCSGGLRHQRADCRKRDLRRPVRDVGRRKERRHQGVAVELTLELQRLLLVPGREDRLRGLDEFAHPPRRVRPRHAEAALDVRLDLRADAKGETALREGVEVMRHVRHRHGRAGERDGHPGLQAQALRMLGGEEQWKERIVRGLGADHAVESQLFVFLRLALDLREIRGQSAINVCCHADHLGPVGTSLNGMPLSTRASCGNLSTRSAMMLRMTSSVPPAMRSAGE